MHQLLVETPFSTAPQLAPSNMSNLSLEAEILISRLSHRPHSVFRTRIPTPYSAKPPTLKLAHRVSSLGDLDRLPPEIVLLLLSMLDGHSIARVALVSFLGYNFVKSVHAYHGLVTFAPQVLWTLKSLGLLGFHSVAQLYSALSTERCATCREYGAFLSLSTCQRCCWDCQGDKTTERFFGIASIPFPSLSKSGRLEEGLWCRGCQTTLRRFNYRLIPQSAIAAIVPADGEPHKVLLSLEKRARSREKFLEHIKHCYGAHQLVPQLVTKGDWIGVS
ncbi:hypothetical protein F5Y08DRAFT_292859 [Xylaria arbuscula]|nr:hypothetical protein F5Y08DRAFT_292859 [Xylaria arbuscula]